MKKIKQLMCWFLDHDWQLGEQQLYRGPDLESLKIPKKYCSRCGKTRQTGNVLDYHLD